MPPKNNGVHPAIPGPHATLSPIPPPTSTETSVLTDQNQTYAISFFPGSAPPCSPLPVPFPFRNHSLSSSASAPHSPPRLIAPKFSTAASSHTVRLPAPPSAASSCSLSYFSTPLSPVSQMDAQVMSWRNHTNYFLEYSPYLWLNMLTPRYPLE